MGAIIKVRTISAATETAAQIANAQFGRAIGIGTSWTTIRVGIRMHMDNTGGALGAGTTLAFGLCKGTTNMFGDASTTHFVGVSTTGSWSFQTTFYNATSPAPVKRVGTTTTTGTVLLANAAFNVGAASNTADRHAYFVDITKGSPNFSFNLFAQSNTVAADVSASTFLVQMEATTPALTSYVYTAAQTLAVSESTDGVLDTVNLSWNKTTPFIEICDVAVARIA